MGTVGKLRKSEDESVEVNLDTEGERRELKETLIEVRGKETRCGEICKKNKSEKVNLDVDAEGKRSEGVEGSFDREI